MHPFFTEEMARMNTADRLAEAERSRLAGPREAVARRLRRVLGGTLIAAGARLSAGLDEGRTTPRHA